MLELARNLALLEKARRDAILACVKPPELAKISESFAASLRTHLMKCERAANLMKAQQEAFLKENLAHAEAIEAAKPDFLAEYADFFAPINEKEPEPEKLPSPPKKRIGFRFED